MERSESLKILAAVIGLVLIVYGTAQALRLRRDAKGQDDDEESNILAAVEEAYYTGEIDEAEYRKALDSIERGGLVDRELRSRDHFPEL